MAVALPPHTPIAPPPSPPAPVALARRQPAPIERRVNTTAAWTLVGVLCAFKIVTISLIYGLAITQRGGDPRIVPLLIVTQWPWLIPLALVISVIPFGFWYRMARARAKRRRLQYAEWNVAC
jgi:drug/metabolite transporter (DMT)-like permease